VGQIPVFTILFAAMLLQASSSLVASFEKIAPKSLGRVGAAVLLLETGEGAGIRAGEKFPMQSVFKLPIGMALLKKVDQGILSLDQKITLKKSDLALPGNASAIRDEHPDGNCDISVRELLHAMMDVSDGTACDVLLRLAGGPAAVTRYLRSLGVRKMEIAVYQKEMSGKPLAQDRNWATPDSAIQLLRALQAGPALSKTSRQLLLRVMAESRTGPKRIKGLLPAGTVVSHKTGSSSTANGRTRATNDVGIVNLPDGNHMAIAVFVYNSRASESVRDGVIAEIARSAWDFYGAR